MTSGTRIKTLIILIAAVVIIHIVIIRILVKSSADSVESADGGSRPSEFVQPFPEPEMNFK